MAQYKIQRKKGVEGSTVYAYTAPGHNECVPTRLHDPADVDGGKMIINGPIAKRMHFGAAIQIRSFLSSQKDEGVDSVWQPDHVVEKIADIVPYLEKLNGRA